MTFNDRERDQLSCQHACARLATHIRFNEAHRRPSRDEFTIRRGEEHFRITVERVGETLEKRRARAPKRRGSR